jgi:serine/threonine protein kinase
MADLYIPGLSVPAHIKAGLEQLKGTYSFEREGTKGANGYVFFGTNRVLKTDIALKIYYWGSDRKYHAEPQLLAHINSPNVLSVFNAGYLDGDWAYFVTPFCSGGDLDDLLAKPCLGNTRAIDLTSHILNGLTFLHQEQLVHRDIKPANVYLNDVGTAVIGDFGSIKRVPNGATVVPASSHAVLYRPPESIDHSEYGFLGDVYQAGIVLYQLLGGYLPYDEASWLSKQELAHYNLLSDHADRSLYADQCIHLSIKAGKLLRIESLAPWVPDAVRRVIRKACNFDPTKRFASPADFMAKLNQLRPSTPDWSIVDGFPTCTGPTSFRIVGNGGLQVQKRKAGAWRNDSSFSGDTLATLVNEINHR